MGRLTQPQGSKSRMTGPLPIPEWWLSFHSSPGLRSWKALSPSPSLCSSSPFVCLVREHPQWATTTADVQGNSSKPVPPASAHSTAQSPTKCTHIPVLGQNPRVCSSTHVHTHIQTLRGHQVSSPSAFRQDHTEPGAPKPGVLPESTPSRRFQRAASHVLYLSEPLDGLLRCSSWLDWLPSLSSLPNLWAYREGEGASIYWRGPHSGALILQPTPAPRRKYQEVALEKDDHSGPEEEA